MLHNLRARHTWAGVARRCATTGLSAVALAGGTLGVAAPAGATTLANTPVAALDSSFVVDSGLAAVGNRIGATGGTATATVTRSMAVSSSSSVPAIRPAVVLHSRFPDDLMFPGGLMVRATVAAPVQPAPQRPRVRLAANRHTIGVNGLVTLTGSVRHRDTGAPIENLVTDLQRLQQGHWRTIAVQRLDRTGRVHFTLRQTGTQTYRLFFPSWRPRGQSVFTSAASAGLTVLVAPTVLAATSMSAGSGLAANRIVAEASRYLGRPYVFGAAGPRAFDCSGLTQYVFARFGIYLPHSAAQQRHYGRPIAASAARPGDIVVFYENGTWGHVGIYIGNGYMIDAPHSGTVVKKQRVWSTQVQYRMLIG